MPKVRQLIARLRQHHRETHAGAAMLGKTTTLETFGHTAQRDS